MTFEDDISHNQLLALSNANYTMAQEWRVCLEGNRTSSDGGLGRSLVEWKRRVTRAVHLVRRSRWSRTPASRRGWRTAETHTKKGSAISRRYTKKFDRWDEKKKTNSEWEWSPNRTLTMAKDVQVITSPNSILAKWNECEKWGFEQHGNLLHDRSEKKRAC